MQLALEGVRQHLAARRRAGDPFDRAWAGALAAVPPPDLEIWAAALAETEDAWRAAYDRLPAAPAERALRAAGFDPERRPFEVPDQWLRFCAMCGDPIPPDRRPNARYCSRACQRATHGRRVAA